MGKDLSYKSFFGEEVSHMESLKNQIKSNIINIIMYENNISEKDFKKIDNIIVDINEDILKEADLLYKENKRINYISEILYDKYFKDNNINESIIKYSEF